MPYAVPSFEQIRDNILRDVRNLLPDADTGADSDHRVRASATAAALEGIYTHQKWIVRQIFPDSADSENLARHAALRGIAPKKPAVAAQGTMRITGVAGLVVPAGLQGSALDGRLYTTAAAGRLDPAGQAVIPAAAVVAGSAGNSVAGTELSLNGAPPGIDSTATLQSMLGGVERETDAELLARLLFIIRHPPAGGNAYDFRRWAMDVPGVTDAYVYPLRRGLGTVDVAITSGGGLPSEATLQAVRDYIESVRPVTAKGVLVFAPVQKLVDLVIEVALSGVALDVARPDIVAALAAQFELIAPGGTWVRSQAGTRVSSVIGITDYNVTEPMTNIHALVDATRVEWLRLGAVSVRPME